MVQNHRPSTSDFRLNPNGTINAQSSFNIILALKALEVVVFEPEHLREELWDGDFTFTTCYEGKLKNYLLDDKNVSKLRFEIDRIYNFLPPKKLLREILIHGDLS